MTTPLFDPKRNPFDDLQNAFRRARQEKKNVLLDLGGDWCVWCHRLEAFIRDHAELRELRDRYYVTVKVYVGSEDETNVEFLNRLPDFDGVPHLLVYNRQGQLLCSQDTQPLEEGESYHYERVKSFLARWSEPRLTPYDALPTAELKRLFEHEMFDFDDPEQILSA